MTAVAATVVHADDIPMKRPHRKSFFQWVPTDDAQLRNSEDRMMRSLRNRYTQHVCAGLNTFSLLLAPEAALYVRRIGETLAASRGAAAASNEEVASFLFGAPESSTAAAAGKPRLLARHLVFIHGFGAGAPLWLPQLRYFAELADGHNTHVLRQIADGLGPAAPHHVNNSGDAASSSQKVDSGTLLFVHAIDLPGFARSKRDVEEFNDAEHVRSYMVAGLRQWVDAMHLDSAARWFSLGVALRTSAVPAAVAAVVSPDEALDAFITGRTGAVAAFAALTTRPTSGKSKKNAANVAPPVDPAAAAAVAAAAGPAVCETTTRAKWQLILAGHSFGGFLSAHFASAYPDLVHHLILCDPWGVPHTDDPFENLKKLPFLIRKAAGLFMGGSLNPLSILRGLGPLGPTVIPKVRKDFGVRWRPLLTPSADRETRGVGRLGASPLSWYQRRTQEEQIQRKHQSERGQQVSVTFPEALQWPTADDQVAAGLLGIPLNAASFDDLHAIVNAALLSLEVRQQAAFMFEESTIEAFEAACDERQHKLQEHAYVLRKTDKRRLELAKEEKCRNSRSSCFGRTDDVAVNGAAAPLVGSNNGVASAGTPVSPVAPVAADAASNHSSAKTTSPKTPAGAVAPDDDGEIDPWTQIFYDYIFHANARLPATGEAAMKSSNVGVGFAHLPLQKTVPAALARSGVHVTALYGRQTWMTPGCGRDLLEELRAHRVAARKEQQHESADQCFEAPAAQVTSPPHAQPDAVIGGVNGGDEDDAAAPLADAARHKWARKREPLTGAALTGSVPASLFPSDGRAMFTQQDDGCIYDFAFVPRASHQLNTDNPADFNALMHRALRM